MRRGLLAAEASLTPLHSHPYCSASILASALVLVLASCLKAPEQWCARACVFAAQQEAQAPIAARRGVSSSPALLELDRLSILAARAKSSHVPSGSPVHMGRRPSRLILSGRQLSLDGVEHLWL
ncbi:hypothetical protein L1887_56885 [Cichorium endivia]|nr:hypothetical protein L1887_56885 [Cichorium endivia]